MSIASQLRLGNYIVNPMEPHQPIKVINMRKGFEFEYVNGFLPKHVRAVPVTDKMLNDLGFVNNVANILFEGTGELKGFCIHKIGGEVYTLKGIAFCKLHILQNIIHTFSQIEITLPNA